MDSQSVRVDDTNFVQTQSGSVQDVESPDIQNSDSADPRLKKGLTSLDKDGHEAKIINHN